MERNHIPGMTIAVIKDGKVVKIAGYGTANLDWDSPVTTDTEFQIASTTKAFTGMLLMKLVEDGKIKLDDSVLTFLPQAPGTWQKVTDRMLATHSSGFKFDLGPGKMFKSVDEAVAEAYKLPLDYEPGTESHYGLTDFVVLMKVLETAGGQRYEALLEERIVAALGLENTRFDGMNDEGPARNWRPMKRRSTTYEWTGKSQQAYAFFYPGWTYSAGGLFSSAADMARVLLAIDSGKFLKPESLNSMWTPIELANGSRVTSALVGRRTNSADCESLGTAVAQRFRTSPTFQS